MLTEVYNGSHRHEWEGKKGGYEWWYVDARTADGNIGLNVTVHETDPFGLDKGPYVSMSVLEAGRDPMYVKMPLEKGAIQTGGEHLVVGGGELIRETEDGLFIGLAFSPEMTVNLRMERLSPQYVHGDGVVYSDPQSGRKAFWIVRVPHGKFSGELKLNGRPVPIQGTAYFDHNWGDCPIQDGLDGWIWGRFGNGEMAVVMISALGVMGGTIQRSIMVADGQVKEIESDLSPLLATLLAGGLNEQRDALVKVDGRVLKFGVGPRQAMRSRLDENAGAFRFDYCRWVTEASLDGNPPIPGVVEFTGIKR